MIMTQSLRPESRRSFGGIDHVDKSTRCQSVDRKGEPLFLDLLGQVAEFTGHPVVLNTSFNGRDEPGVWRPEDALRTFGAIGLDALVIGHLLIRKR